MAALDPWLSSILHDSRPWSRPEGVATTSPQADRSPLYSCYAELYDEAVGFAAYPVILDAVEWSISRYLPAPQTAADVGCGTGLLLPYLASIAERVYAVDRSPAMLCLARKRASGLPVRLLRQDLRRLSLPEPVHLITCTFDTLNYLLSSRAVMQALNAMRRNLVAGGLLLFDLITGARWQDAFTRSVQCMRRPSFDVVWRIRTEPARRLSIVDVRSTPRTAGAHSQCREVHVQRWYPLKLVRQLVQSAGLEVRDTRDLDTERSATEASHWVHIVATR